MAGKVNKFYAAIRERRNAETGEAQTTSKEVAGLVRGKLREKFPRVKFSVRSDYNSINVHWNDGPTQREVEEVIGQYSFGGFDGSIDLAYFIVNWILPDGSMVPASSPGTEGSRGSVPAFATDCPTPGAVLVRGGPRYVFGQRRTSVPV